MFCFSWCLHQVSSSLKLKAISSYVGLWSAAHPFLLLPCSQSLWGPFIWRGSLSAAGTDGTMRRYNSLASLHFPFWGVWSLLLAEAQLGRKQDNWDGKWLARVPGWITYIQYGCWKCSELRRKITACFYSAAVIRGCSAAGLTLDFLWLVLLLFHWQQLAEITTNRL